MSTSEPQEKKTIRGDVLALSEFCQNSPATKRYPGIAGVFYDPALGCWIGTDGRAWMMLPEIAADAARMRWPLWIDAALARGLRKLKACSRPQVVSDDLRRVTLRYEQLVQCLPPPQPINPADNDRQLYPCLPDCLALCDRPPVEGRAVTTLKIELLRALVRFAAAADAEYVTFFPGAAPDEPVGVALHGGFHPTAAIGAICPVEIKSFATDQTPGQRLAKHVKEVNARRAIEPAQTGAGGGRGGEEGASRDGAAAAGGEQQSGVGSE